VTTALNPDTSAARASVVDATLQIPGLPVVKSGLLQSTATASCATATGSTTISFLQVGNTVLIPSPTPISPNTIINLGLVQAVLNEQRQDPTADRGVTVNAVHLFSRGLVDLVLASSTAGMHGCGQ
jgi:hypothetical protein